MRLPDLSSRVAIGGLVGLALLDIVLVATALGSTRTGDVDTRPLGSASSSSDSIRAVVPSVTPSVTSTANARTAQVAPLRTMLVALDSERAWRARVGSCSAGGASVSTTTDGGKTWVQGSTPPLRTVVRVQPADDRVAFVVGADSSCTARVSETSNGANTWGAPGTAAGAWFRHPKNSRIVGAPGPAVSQPCGKREVLDLAPVSANSARVLCADGSVRSSADTGSSWIFTGKVAGGVALAVLPSSPAKAFVARLNPPDCSGVQIQQVGNPVATSCIRSALPKGLGQVSLSLVRGGGWVVIGGTTMRSTDDLATWTTP